MKRILTVLVVFSSALSMSGLAQSPSQKDVAHIVASMSEFRDISVWKGRTGLMHFSADGKYIAVSAKTADIAIYSTETGKIVSMIDGKGFLAVSFSPDSKNLVVQHKVDSSMEIFEVESGKSLRSIRGAGSTSRISKSLGGTGIINEINGVFPTIVIEMGRIPAPNDWRNLLVNKNDSEFSLYDFETGSLKYELKHADYSGGKERAKIALALLIGGGSLYLGSASNTRFSDKGTFLLIANGNRQPTLWKAATGELVAKLDSTARVMYHRFSPDESMVATSDYEGITRVWDTANGQMITTIGSKKQGAMVAAWSSDSSKIILIPEKTGDLAAFDPKSGQPEFSYSGSVPDGALFSDNLKFVATRPRKNKAVLFQLWETDTGKLLATVPRGKNEDAIISLKWNPNDYHFATSQGLKDDIKIWNTKGERLQTLTNTTVPMEFSSDGKLLATGGRLANNKTDIGYIWAFAAEPRENERLGMLRNEYERTH
jgi:WD40 repeat protein